MRVVDSERGSGTVLLAGVVAGAVVLFGGGTALVSAQRASAQARTAADLAALAAASTSAGSRPRAGCVSARSIAVANGARLLRCTELGGGDFEVVVAVRAATPGLGEATARARAGPDRTDRIGAPDGAEFARMGR